MMPTKLLVLFGAFCFAETQSLTNIPSKIELLYDRPAEPIYFPKGQNEEVNFILPEEYVPKRFRKKAFAIGNRAAGDAVRVDKVDIPDVAVPLQLGRRDQYSHFLPKHREITKKLVEALMTGSAEEFLSRSVFLRDRVNPFLFAYALSVVSLHRNDTQGAAPAHLPSLFPEKFLDGAVFYKARLEANLVELQDRLPIEIPRDFTATDLEPEHRVAYFREDVGVNLHHWNWHVMYPNQGGALLVAKDRRGELFYYAHEQILRRYNFERFCNGLGRVKRLLNWREPIEEGYFPKLDTVIASRVWAPRLAGSVLQDIDRDDMDVQFDIQDLERWRDRIYSAINAGRVLASNGSYIPLDDFNGIDILGNILEKTDLSVNGNLYGDLHNLGHVALALVHDPDHKHLETFAVMGSVETAMRDPVFYRWHSFINDLFIAHKQTLQPYNARELEFPGIRVARADVVAQGAAGPNDLLTFWQQDDLDLSRGLDFVAGGEVFVRVTHLMHAPFRYFIQVENRTPVPQIGTVRIFMAPQYDERGIPLKFRDQRHLFIEMDKFQYRFQPGANAVERRSTQSSVTVPYGSTFRNLSRGADSPCACGWPQHMLVPKGSAAGFRAQLFVMVSDDPEVRVRPAAGVCAESHSLCGVRGQAYPDARPMGFPFDRAPPPDAATLDAFLRPNMRATPLAIWFRDETRAPAAPAPR